MDTLNTTRIFAVPGSSWRSPIANFVIVSFTGMAVYLALFTATRPHATLQFAGWVAASILFPSAMLLTAHFQFFAVRRLRRALRGTAGREIVCFSNAALVRPDGSTAILRGGIISGGREAFEVWEGLDSPRVVFSVRKGELVKVWRVSVLRGAFHTPLLRLEMLGGEIFECQPVFADIRDLFGFWSGSIRRVADCLTSAYGIGRGASQTSS